MVNSGHILCDIIDLIDVIENSHMQRDWMHASFFLPFHVQILEDRKDVK